MTTPGDLTDLKPVYLIWGSEDQRKGFHRFSTIVWGVWMVTLVSGFLLAIPEMFAKIAAEKAAGGK